MACLLGHGLYATRNTSPSFLLSSALNAPRRVHYSSGLSLGSSSGLSSGLSGLSSGLSSSVAVGLSSGLSESDADDTHQDTRPDTQPFSQQIEQEENMSSVLCMYAARGKRPPAHPQASKYKDVHPRTQQSLHTGQHPSPRSLKIRVSPNIMR